MNSEMDQQIDFAWRVHSALDTWTTKVDNKASIVLAIEAATLGLVVTLSRKGGPLSELHGTPHTKFLWGMIALGLGTFFAALAVFPQLRRIRASREWQRGFIYFGHLRHWDSAKLATHLERLDPKASLAALSNQHVVMAKIAWRKHVWLQVSMLLSLIGVGLLFLSAT